MSHVDDKNLPTMVDVTEKKITHRIARAQSFVQLPVEMKSYVNGNELTLKKGPVFQTAIIAGTMAAKKTSELIPFCHQIPLTSCKIDISIDSSLLIKIDCEVKAEHKTGVEMEALHGAMTAALTVYDMCKAVSHNIVIQETKVTFKVGGKSTLLDRPTYGLVMTGGKSERMGQDKALINYKGVPHAQYIANVLSEFCTDVFLSAKLNQWANTALEPLPTINDSVEGRGPIVGILSAFEKYPDANWIVAACDLVHFNRHTVETLIANFDAKKVATTFTNAEKQFPEALCAIYTPSARAVLASALSEDITCPVKVLRNSDINLIASSPSVNLANINTKLELMEVQNQIC